MRRGYKKLRQGVPRNFFSVPFSPLPTIRCVPLSKLPYRTKNVATGNFVIGNHFRLFDHLVIPQREICRLRGKRSVVKGGGGARGKKERGSHVRTLEALTFSFVSFFVSPFFDLPIMRCRWWCARLIIFRTGAGASTGRHGRECSYLFSDIILSSFFQAQKEEGGRRRRDRFFTTSQKTSFSLAFYYIHFHQSKKSFF
jgi:hypothetical protein